MWRVRAQPRSYSFRAILFMKSMD